MPHSRNRIGVDIALRFCGAFMLATVWFAGRSFSPIVTASRPETVSPPELAIAMALFLSASIGAALMMLGLHLFDHVEVAERWRY
ncbi:hypothetical protein [Sphingobium phenoxybenzoativorans]|uniref:hypothetical protein n=1 Tax=Sphingobium phenoxybenzoativorans TaxID=1592790 RepID=UPI00087326C3|nr:hypothetical protein [Sphingobium phenoxybenzoativorans]